MIQASTYSAKRNDWTIPTGAAIQVSPEQVALARRVVGIHTTEAERAEIVAMLGLDELATA